MKNTVSLLLFSLRFEPDCKLSASLIISLTPYACCVNSAKSFYGCTRLSLKNCTMTVGLISFIRCLLLWATHVHQSSTSSTCCRFQKLFRDHIVICFTGSLYVITDLTLAIMNSLTRLINVPIWLVWSQTRL